MSLISPTDRPRKDRTRPAGFSLVELLVVIAVVAAITMLALPAVQAARSQARRITCANNLKQVALAMHNYHDTFRTFPPPYCHGHGEPQDVALWGWSVRLLPFMEQMNIFDQLDFNRPAPAPNGLLTRPLAVYRCPSDPTSATNPFRGGYGTLNYSLNYGDRPFPRWIPNQLGLDWPGTVPTIANIRDVTGIAWLNHGGRIRDITDGTSNTFMVGERGVTSGAGIWMGVTATHHEDDQLTDCSHFSRLNRSRSGYSSQHGGGAHFAFGDGSVRFVADSIESLPPDPEGQQLGMYQKLANRRDGHPVEF